MKYPSIRLEGAILSPDLIERLEELPGQGPSDFGLDGGTKVKDEIARAWADAQDYWRVFQRRLEALKPDATATTETRNLWMVPLLGLLRYDLEYQKSGVALSGKTYAISHRVTNRGMVPVQIIGYREAAGLDRKPDNATLRMSAHALLQEFLNLDEQLYGLATNGRVLRLLRDSSRLVKQSFVEFDLERIFTDGLFADFAVLYRLLHATRLPLSAEAASGCLLERYHQDSLDSGARIRDGLSKAVEEAILAFGNGFLTHPANANLRESLASGELEADGYYQALLRLIYRLLFLMVIEERGLVFPPETSRAHRLIYDRFYAVGRLRALAERRHLADRRQGDLWLALLSTFRLYEPGGPGERMGLKPLGGDLFRDEALGPLTGCQLSNDVLLGCLRAMGLYEHPTSRQLIRVNYAALNVEEFGSVYEGLLEYAPEVSIQGTEVAFGFKAGDERSATGSHYTPDDLVQPLIRHSLDYLIADRLKAPDPEAELLDLKVADIACGSGHILLAAARRIATELAIVRTGEEQPSPTAYRKALRDVIRNCIYGVDLNPLAVELCKVALWLEAHNPGEPLNFLDHRIKCGNAIVGYVRREEVDAGVPEEAFAKLPGDDPEVGKKIRSRNKSERKSRDQTRLTFTKDRQGQIDAVLDMWKTIAEMPERVPAEIDAKKAAFDTFMSSGASFVLKQIASIPIAQFYLPRIPENEPNIITDEAFREYWSGNISPQGQAPAAAVGISTKKRFFHWFLEFPEIIQRGGFDCILGNPPFLGNRDLKSTYGEEFLNYVRYAYEPAGSVDLVTYFFRRVYELLRPNAFQSLIATKTVYQGNARDGGLDVIISRGGTICFARRSIRWPGKASVSVALISIIRGEWGKDKYLDDRRVQHISSFLDTADADTGNPLRLLECEDKSFQGTIVLGEGFVLEPSEEIRLRAINPKYSDVVLPFLIGDDINSRPDQSASRHVINFYDWPEERAQQYVDCYKIIEMRVKPERTRRAPNGAFVLRKPLPEKWWIYSDKRPKLYSTIARFQRVLVAVRISKYLNMVFVRNGQVFNDKVIVTAFDDFAHFATLQSAVHSTWAWKHSGTLGSGTLIYSPSKCFVTFPFPDTCDPTNLSRLADIGGRYHEHRRKLMLSLWLGLTDVYNLFHSREVEGDLAKHFASRAKKDSRGESIPEEHRAGAVSFTPEQALAGILELRRLNGELDTAVCEAYGWHDLPLEHDFYEVEMLPENDRVRYTISAAARKELLRRLLAENHRRAALEAASAAQAPRSAGKRAGKKRQEAGPSLFGEEDG